MKTAKGIIVILLILAVVLSLIACVADSHREDAPSPGPNPNAQVSDEEKEPEQDSPVQTTPAAEEPTEDPAAVPPEEKPAEEPQEPVGEPETTPAPSSPEDEKIAKLTSRGLDPDKPMVALTFDDGPDPDYTLKILDTLAEHGAVATFFEVGNMAKEYPDLIKKELEYGCELGSHTYSHKDLTSISEEEAQAEIDKAIDVFVDITGEAPTLLRPPYGSIGDRKSLARAPVVTWSVDTEDWKSRDPVAVLESIKSESNLDGMVVLMHSIHGSTYNALEDILDYLDSKGYQCVTVSELAYYKHGEVLEPGHLYGYSYFQPSDNSDN